MKLRFLALCLVGLALGSTSGQAQIIWNTLLTGTITADTDVLTNGSYFDATQLQYSHSTAQTVNGVVFNAFNGSNTDGTISLSNAGEGGDGYYSGAPGVSASYQAILNNVAYNDYPQSGAVTIGSLTLNHVYQVQIWLGPAAGRGTDYSGTTPLYLNGADYGVGVFTALTSSLAFTFTSDPAVHTYGEIQAISVRDITTAPEPSTWMLLLGSAGLLSYGLRRKFARA